MNKIFFIFDEMWYNKNMKKQNSFSKKIMLLSLAISFLLACGFLFDFILNYNVMRGLLLQDADDRLLAAANGVKYVIGTDFHDKITDEKSVSDGEHEKNVAVLSELAAKCGVDYVYSMGKFGDKIVFTSLSATKEELEKKSYDKFFKIYNSASENVIKSFSNGETVFEEFEDEYGNFRSVIIPVKMASGAYYLLGADISISSLSSKLNSVKNGMLYNTLLISIIFVALCLILSYFMPAYFETAPVGNNCNSNTPKPAAENNSEIKSVNEKIKPEK